MQLYPFKFGLPYVFLGLPFGYMVIQSSDQSPWLAALAMHLFLSFMLWSWYSPFAYRVSTFTIWGRALLGACVAFAVAPVYALIMAGSLDNLFVLRHP